MCLECPRGFESPRLHFFRVFEELFSKPLELPPVLYPCEACEAVAILNLQNTEIALLVVTVRQITSNGVSVVFTSSTFASPTDGSSQAPVTNSDAGMRFY